MAKTTHDDSNKHRMLTNQEKLNQPGRRIRFNEQKLDDLGLWIESRDDGACYLGCAFGDEPILHEEMERHVKSELGQRALVELQEAAFMSYMALAIKASLS